MSVFSGKKPKPAGESPQGQAERAACVEEFLSVCTGQMRCRAMRSAVDRELYAHILDQKEACMAEGMTEEEAEREAVRQMGDPVAVGVGLDRIHRPRTDWRAAGCIVLLAVLGTAAQYSVNGQEGGAFGFLLNFSRSTLVGILLMFGVCYADYTVLGKYPRAIWCGGVLLYLLAPFYSAQINGNYRTEWIVALLAAAYAGLVFYYRSQGLRGILKALAWLLGTCALMAALDSIPAGILQQLWLGGCVLILAFAVGKGWYGVKKLWALPMLLVFALAGAALFAVRMGQNGIFARRFRVLQNPYLAENDGGFLYVQLRRALAGLSLFGASEGEGLSLAAGDPESFFLMGVWERWGLLAGLALVAALLLTVAFLAYRVLRQKNRLGVLTGLSCLLVLLLPVGMNVLMNTGYFWITACGLPFLSIGGRLNVSLYVLMGLLLSVLRNQESLPEPEGAAVGGVRLRLVVEKGPQT